MYINRTKQKHSTKNKKQIMYKYTYYQNTQTLQNPHITNPTHTHTRTSQNKLKQPPYKFKQRQ